MRPSSSSAPTPASRKSDLAIWRDHLGAHAPTRFVVLNKIDALRDPLATAAARCEAQIDAAAREHRAHARRAACERVFPLSARQALAARVAGDDDGAARDSRAARARSARSARSCCRSAARCSSRSCSEAAQQIEAHVARHLGDRRRQLAEQMLELRGLRGKNSAKVRLMLQRVDAETAEFEQCTTLLQAMRSVHARMLKDAAARPVVATACATKSPRCRRRWARRCSEPRRAARRSSRCASACARCSPRR